MRNPGSRLPGLTCSLVAALSGLALVGGLTVVLAAGPAAAASSSGTSGSSGGSSSSRPNLSAFRTCLSQHGVTLRPRTAGGFPGAGPGGPPPTGAGAPTSGGFRGGFAGGPNSKQAKAFAACRSKLPAGGFGGRFGGGQFKPTAAQQQALTAFEQCMSTHGVKIAPGATFQTIRSLMQADPTASTACRSDLQGAFGRSRGSVNSSSSSTTNAP